jgi:hypothetical protein
MSALNPADDAAYTARSVAYTGTAGSTSTWPPGNREVMVWATTDAYIKVGVGVTATTASTPVPAFTPVKFRVPFNANEPWRVSAIQVAAGGTVYAKPLEGSL